MVKLPSAKVYSLSVSVSYPGQSPKCVKVTTLGPRTLHLKTPVKRSSAKVVCCFFLLTYLINLIIETNRVDPDHRSSLIRVYIVC